MELLHLKSELKKYWRWSLKLKVNKIIVGITDNEKEKDKKKIL